MKREKALRILRANKREWVSKYGLTKLGVFGSVARDQADSNSDIDVVIQMSVPDIFRLVSLREEMMNAFGTKVDLITDHDNLRPYFKNRLQSEAIYV